MEEWTAIRYLHAQGKSIRAISQELSVARNTVRAALRSEQPRRYTRPSRPNPQLAPFAEEIRRMVVEQQFIGTRILRELRARGYAGSLTALYAYLRGVKAELPDPRVTERFETPPGQQGQFDWSPYTVVLGGQTVKVVIFCLTLGYSRRKYYWPSRNETQASIFEGLEASFRHFGGVPKEVLVDNAKALVVDAHPEHFRWNRVFLEFCGHYAFRPVACRPYRARTKGKVERPFFYLEQHFIKGGQWASFEAFAAALAAFTAELDTEVHRTTQARPIDRFEAEREHLTPLPTRGFVGSREAVRKVSWDCLLSFGGSRYSVPWAYAGKLVWVRPAQGAWLVVRNQQGVELARHALADQKGATVIDPAHYAGLRQGLPKTRTLLEAAFLRRFPDAQWFLDGLFIQHKVNGVAHLRAILGLAELYAPEALGAAFAAARTYTTYSHRFIRGLLEAEGTTQLRLLPVDSPPRPAGTVDADLAVYQQILEARR